MGLKKDLKETAEGKGMVGLALAVAIGVGILAPLFAALYAWIKSKVTTATGTTTSAS